jgi:hypothetical protein
LKGGRLPRLLRAGLLTGVSDGLFSSVLSVFFYHSTVARLFQGVASVLLGRKALDGGTATALIGVAMHFGVAFGWSAVFLALASISSRIRGVLGTRFGALGVASVYGPSIWVIMSCVVIPLLVRRPPKLSARWWTQFFGHIPFVGVPIVTSIARASDGADARAR